MLRQVKRTGQAVHPALAPLALGLLALGAGLDVLAAGREGPLTWLAFWIIACGVAAGTWSAMFAVADWVFFADAGETGVCGLGGFPTALIVGIYGLAALLRVASPEHVAPPAAMALEVAGAALVVTKTWVGRELASWLRERR
jgi:uncharacterized membrane protein